MTRHGRQEARHAASVPPDMSHYLSVPAARTGRSWRPTGVDWDRVFELLAEKIDSALRRKGLEVMAAAVSERRNKSSTATRGLCRRGPDGRFQR